MFKLNRLFNIEMKKCNQLLKDYVSEAKKDENFSKDITKEKVIEEYLCCLNFFKDFDLLYDAQERLADFHTFLKQAQEMINNAKEFSKLNDD